jgi:2-polyprenyl-3-methyl-5-hydroxy-6-metoxy-1,4-benzoquinol methylase
MQRPGAILFCWKRPLDRAVVGGRRGIGISLAVYGWSQAETRLDSAHQCEYSRLKASTHVFGSHKARHSMLTTQDIKTAVSRYWSGRAAEFDQGASHGVHNEVQHQAWLGLLREVAGPPPLKVLDVGCGTGFLAMRMAELGHTAVGVDLSEDMLAEARRKTEGTRLAVTFQVGDAEAPSPDGAPYDVILERHVLWTLPQPREAVRAWQALLRPGGLLILIEGIFEMSDRTVYPQLEAQLPLYGGRPGEELATLLEAEGFVQMVVRPLMDAALWLETPTRPRFMVTGRRPIDASSSQS